ncbi:MAG: DUF86 domain-containing protein [Hyphomicrobiales bacterium]|nr:DUF86 domain-containing protein [Hyphomicrobiales bacterium]
MARSLRLAIEDMLTAIERIDYATQELTLEQFQQDWRARYIVERGLMIVSEASRSIPDDLKDRHPHIRWIGVRDIGNVLRHQYASLSATLLWNVVRDELPRLKVALEAMMPPT